MAAATGAKVAVAESAGCCRGWLAEDEKAVIEEVHRRQRELARKIADAKRSEAAKINKMVREADEKRQKKKEERKVKKKEKKKR